MTGLLVIGGEGPGPQALRAYAGGWDTVIAADSGYELALRLGLSPELVVGDMDSISAASLAAIPPERLRRYPREKDETDTEIGLRVLDEMGCGRRIIVGGGGGRMDHFLGICCLFDRENPPRLWITHTTVFALIEQRAQYACRRDEVVSFFAAGGVALVSDSSGLRWPLRGLRLGEGRASLSNRTVSERISVRLEQGRLLMVRAIEEG